MAVVRGDVPAAREASARPGLGRRLARVGRQCAGCRGFRRGARWLARRRRRGFVARGRRRSTCGSTSRSTGSARSTRCWRPGSARSSSPTAPPTCRCHLEHEGRPAGRAAGASGRGWRCSWWRWSGWPARSDLVLLFVFFDLTAVASYFLIGFDRDRREARGAALMALLVTGVSAVALLHRGRCCSTPSTARSRCRSCSTRAAAGPDHDHRRRADRRRRAGQERAGAAALLAAARDGRAHAGLGLPALGGDGRRRGARARPRASAAGARARPCSTGCSWWAGLDRRRRACSRSRQDELKQILAYSTISQYGYVVALYGIGGAAGAGAAALYVLAHAIAKSALFMTAGRGHRGDRRGPGSRASAGSRRRMPVLAVGERAGRGRRSPRCR